MDEEDHVLVRPLPKVRVPKAPSSDLAAAPENGGTEGGGAFATIFVESVIGFGTRGGVAGPPRKVRNGLRDKRVPHALTRDFVPVNRFRGAQPGRQLRNGTRFHLAPFLVLQRLSLRDHFRTLVVGTLVGKPPGTPGAEGARGTDAARRRPTGGASISARAPTRQARV